MKVSEQRDSDTLSDEVVQGIEELHGSARGIYLLAIKLARAQLRSVDGLLADLQTAIERQAENETRPTAAPRRSSRSTGGSSRLS